MMAPHQMRMCTQMTYRRLLTRPNATQLKLNTVKIFRIKLNSAMKWPTQIIIPNKSFHFFIILQTSPSLADNVRERVPQERLRKLDP